MAEEKQDGQKTLVAFVVGLLIGGMLVWAFSDPSTPTEEENVTVENGSEEVTLTDDDDSDDSSDSETETESESDNQDETTNEVAELPIGDGDVVVADQPASDSIKLESATYPVSEGWIGVREYNGEELGHILGVVRFSESQGLVPSTIELVRPTVAGNTYAVVVFTEDGDFEFNLANDVQIDTIFDTFVAE